MTIWSQKTNLDANQDAAHGIMYQLIMVTGHKTDFNLFCIRIILSIYPEWVFILEYQCVISVLLVYCRCTGDVPGMHYRCVYDGQIEYSWDTGSCIQTYLRAGHPGSWGADHPWQSPWSWTPANAHWPRSGIGFLLDCAPGSQWPGSLTKISASPCRSSHQKQLLSNP